MYGHICISHNGCTAIYKTNDYYSIYDSICCLGFDHYTAEDVACWAELAVIGDERELDGVEIWIEE